MEPKEMIEPYFEQGGITLYNADCRDVLPSLSGIDLTLTDPPFGINKAEWDKEFLTDWMAHIRSAGFGLMPGVWNLLSCPREIGSLKYRWTLAACLINGMTNGGLGFGNWIPCLVYSTDENSLWRQEGDTRQFVVGTEAKPEHPSPKPLRVMQWLVERLTDKSQTICDPFVGSGTTLVAAKLLNRKAIGIELSEKYCEIAARRLENTAPLFDKPEALPEQELFN